MVALTLFFGAVVGLSLGLTGGGGALFAVPLLVYGSGVHPREAISISLVAVGATALVGFLHRWNLGEVEIRTGLMFALAGMLGAPIGTWIASLIPESILLLLFAVLMLIIAVRLWQQASSNLSRDVGDTLPIMQKGPCCQRDSDNVLLISSRCAAVLLIAGSLTGILSGMFGVGGGFVIVPALVLFSGMSIHRAVGTSLMVIALISVSGIASQLWVQRTIAPIITGLFVLGGIGGLFAGQRIGRRLSGPALQKLFAVAIIAVAGFVFVRNFNFAQEVAAIRAVYVPSTPLDSLVSQELT